MSLEKENYFLHSSEIKKLKNQSERKGYTIIPLELFIKNGWAKLKIAVGRGRKKFDKKEYLKERDIEKETKKDLGY
jgi:SsrA-binding protein